MPPVVSRTAQTCLFKCSKTWHIPDRSYHRGDVCCCCSSLTVSHGWSPVEGTGLVTYLLIIFFAARVPLSAAGWAVVLQRGFGKSLPSEVNSERLPVPALTDTQRSHRLFPCSISSVGPVPNSYKKDGRGGMLPSLKRTLVGLQPITSRCQFQFSLNVVFQRLLAVDRFGSAKILHFFFSTQRTCVTISRPLPWTPEFGMWAFAPKRNYFSTHRCQTSSGWYLQEVFWTEVP